MPGGCTPPWFTNVTASIRSSVGSAIGSADDEEDEEEEEMDFDSKKPQNKQPKEKCGGELGGCPGCKECIIELQARCFPAPASVLTARVPKPC